MMRSTLSTFTKHTIGRVLRRTSTKQRSITLVVRSLRHRCRGKAKNDSNSGKSCSSRRTTAPYCRRQRAPKLRKAVSALPRPCTAPRGPPPQKKKKNNLFLCGGLGNGAPPPPPAGVSVAPPSAPPPPAGPGPPPPPPPPASPPPKKIPPEKTENPPPPAA